MNWYKYVGYVKTTIWQVIFLWQHLTSTIHRSSKRWFLSHVSVSALLEYFKALLECAKLQNYIIHVRHKYTRGCRRFSVFDVMRFDYKDEYVCIEWQKICVTAWQKGGWIICCVYITAFLPTKPNFLLFFSNLLICAQYAFAIELCPFAIDTSILMLKMAEGYLMTMNFIYCRTSLHIFMHFKNALVGKMYLLLTKTRMVQNDITNYSCSGVKFLQQLGSFQIIILTYHWTIVIKHIGDFLYN